MTTYILETEIQLLASYWNRDSNRKLIFDAIESALPHSIIYSIFSADNSNKYVSVVLHEDTEDNEEQIISKLSKNQRVFENKFGNIQLILIRLMPKNLIDLRESQDDL